MSTSSRLPPIATLGPLIALVLASAFFATQSDRFLSIQNFSLILQQVMVVGTIAIGQTLVILTAGIDLSCGMVMALGGIVMTKLAVTSGMNPYAAIACGLLVCMAFGLVNGLLVTRIRLPSFIVTLGTMNGPDPTSVGEASGTKAAKLLPGTVPAATGDLVKPKLPSVPAP